MSPTPTLRQRAAYAYRRTLMRGRGLVQRTRWAAAAQWVAPMLFFIGATRSGKTLISRLMAHHPDVTAYPSEANHLWHPETHPWIHSRHRHVLPPHWADPRSHVEKSIALRGPYHGDHIRTVFGVYSRLHDTRLLINDSAKTTFLVSYILKPFPGARFVYVMRDGRCVAHLQAEKVSRAISRQRWLYAEAGYALPFEEVLATCATNWTAHGTELERLRAGQRTLDPDSLIAVRYEDFCRSPLKELRRLCEFAGLDPDGLPHPLPLDIRDRNPEVRGGIGEDANRTLHGIMGMELARNGYL